MSSKYDPNTGDWVERITDSFFAIITIGIMVFGVIAFVIGVITSR